MILDDTELQKLIEKRLRDYVPPLNTRAALQLERLDALGRKLFPAEEKLSLFNSAKQGLTFYQGPN